MLFAPSRMEIIESTPLEVVDQPPAVKDKAAPPESEEIAASTAQTVEPAVERKNVPNDVAKDDVASTEDNQELFPDDDQELFPEDATETAPVVQGEDAVGPSEQISRTSAKPPVDGAPRVFRLSSLSKEIDAADNPVIGNPYAARRFVEMMDYTCPHCRKLNPFIKAAVERYGDQLGFVIYHVPLSRKCNQLVQMDQAMHANACEYARLAYGVWKLTPDKFPEFHDWLMEGKKAPPIFDAKQKAMKLAGGEVLVDKQIALESNQRVVDHANQMEPLKVGLPILVFDGGIVRGMPETEAEWFQMLEQRMGMQVPASATN
jgi:protein-disulfide isomerase